MEKVIATVEIAIEQKATPVKTVRAELVLQGTNSYTVTILDPGGSIRRDAIGADSEEPARFWLVQQLKAWVDQFDPNEATVKVVSDSLHLLPKVTYRCSNPQCHAKLFESWGPALGIRIVCRKCKTLGIPQAG